MDIDNPVTILIYDSRGEKVSVHFVKPDSKNFATDYQISLNETLSISDGFHCSIVSIYRDSDGNDRFYMYYLDKNNEKICISEQLGSPGAKFEYIDNDTGELIFENEYTSDHMDYIGPPDKNITYVVKVTLTDQLIPSYFSMVYDEIGIARFELLESEEQRSMINSDNILVIRKNNELLLDILLKNDEATMVSYNIRKSSEEVVIDDTIRITPFNDEIIRIIINKEDLIKDRDMSLIVLKNGNYLERISVVDLFTTDIVNHWACDNVRSQFFDGNIYNREGMVFVPMKM